MCDLRTSASGFVYFDVTEVSLSSPLADFGISESIYFVLELYFVLEVQQVSQQVIVKSVKSVKSVSKLVSSSAVD